MQVPLQNRVDLLRDGQFLGVPFDDFERGGREQLIIPEMPVRSRSGRAFELLRERMRPYHFV